MRQTIKIVFFVIINTTFVNTFFTQAQSNEELWFSFYDSTSESYSYRNEFGKVMLERSKFAYCFTDTFRTYAIVLDSTKGFIAINRAGQVLYNIFVYDNGPDYPEQGLFRIIKNNKIGYASANTGVIVIEPQFSCAWPFDESGKAKVALECRIENDGEHQEWMSKAWFFIDKTGKRIKQKSK